MGRVSGRTRYYNEGRGGDERMRFNVMTTSHRHNFQECSGLRSQASSSARLIACFHFTLPGVKKPRCMSARGELTKAR